MKQFLKRLMLSVVTLAMLCCVTPLAFADNPNYYTIYLERQGGTSGKGPIGSKGPGETQLETDRRLINKKIDKIRADLEEVRRSTSSMKICRPCMPTGRLCRASPPRSRSRRRPNSPPAPSGWRTTWARS